MSALAKALPDRIKPSGFVARFALMAVALLLLAPAVLSDFRLSLLAKFLCFAIIAIGIGLAWGQGGMLVLGQGLFFGLGGYCMGMHMKIVDAGPGNLPDILSYSGKYETLPSLWKPFTSAWFAVPMAILLPMAIAALLGAAIFRQRIRGAYFAILSQALAAAFVIVIVGNLSLTGGTNGLTNFQSFFGLNVTSAADQKIIYFIVAITLLLVFLGTRSLVLSRYGRLLIASRDDEDRVRFLGYDPARVKLVGRTRLPVTLAHDGPPGRCSTQRPSTAAPATTRRRGARQRGGEGPSGCRHEKRQQAHHLDVAARRCTRRIVGVRPDMLGGTAQQWV